MVRLIFTLGLAALLSCHTASAGADNSDPANEQFESIDAQALIDRCHGLGEEFFEGDIGDIREGYIRIEACLRSTIINQLGPMFEPDQLSPAYADWMLTRMADPMEDIYGYLFNAHMKCDCGESYQAADIEAVVRLYERLLRDIVDQRNTFHM